MNLQFKLNPRFLAILGLALVLLVASATWVLAQTDGVIYACVLKDGTLRIVPDAYQCKKVETLLSWNILGPKGDPGLACWDLNANGATDSDEDVNKDGEVDVLDCKGPQGERGAGLSCENQQALKAAIPGFQVSSECYPSIPGMVIVPGGAFQMGCDAAIQICNDDELPRHTVTLDDYYIDITEVTTAQYSQCVDASACDAPTNFSSFNRQYYYGNPEYADYPVIYVTWYDARDYCNWAGKRLPTEAEWEKAARGTGDSRVYPWGNQLADCSLANYSPSESPNYNCVGNTSQVGSYPAGASPYGVLDMSGNVWEWVNDWDQWDYYSVSPSVNPQGPDTGTAKVLRGGGWESPVRNIRAAVKSRLDPTFPYAYAMGFRCAAAGGE